MASQPENETQPKAQEETKPESGEVRRPAAPAAALAQSPVPVQSGEEASRSLSPFSGSQAFAVAQRMATALSQSSLVPSAYQGPQGLPNVLIAMELANRIGASPMMVMQNLDVIHGRPSWRAQFLIATVNASGRFSPLRFRFTGKEGTDEWGCRAWALDRETKEECVGPLVTIKLAKDEGWYKRNGSKWQTLPELMLHYRAAAFWARIYAPELSLGMQTAEEVIDTTGVVLPDVPAALAPGSVKALEAELMNGAHAINPRAGEVLSTVEQ